MIPGYFLFSAVKSTCFTIDVSTAAPQFGNCDKHSKEQVLKGLKCQMIVIETNFYIL